MEFLLPIRHRVWQEEDGTLRWGSLMQVSEGPAGLTATFHDGEGHNCKPANASADLTLEMVDRTVEAANAKGRPSTTELINSCLDQADAHGVAVARRVRIKYRGYILLI